MSIQHLNSCAKINGRRLCISIAQGEAVEIPKSHCCRESYTHVGRESGRNNPRETYDKVLRRAKLEVEWAEKNVPQTTLAELKANPQIDAQFIDTLDSLRG